MDQTSSTGKLAQIAIDEKIADAIRNLPDHLDAETKAAVKASLEATFQRVPTPENTATVCMNLVDVKVGDSDLVSMIESTFRIIGTDAFVLDAITVTHPVPEAVPVVEEVVK